MLLQLLQQQISILHSIVIVIKIQRAELKVPYLCWVQRQERISEAGRESGLGLRHPALSARNLGRVAREEVVHGLTSAQTRDRREHTEGVRRQKDDVLGVAAHGSLLVVGDVVDGVGHARVLRFMDIKIVNSFRHGVHSDILEQSISLDGAEDIRLRLLRQIDGFGVTASFKIEDAVIVPSVLVVSDEEAVGIRGESGLTGAGQTEEQSGVAIGACDSQ